MRRFRFQSRHKFSSRVSSVDGIKFQSAAEAKRYGQLKLLEAAGEVSDIKPHPRFKIEHNGVRICTVVLDFSYKKNGKLVYEDVKVQRYDRSGKTAYTTDTRHSKIGRNLLKAFYGIEVFIFFA